MRKKKEGEFRSSVYENRPAYADFESAAKFEAIKSIIAKHLKLHPKAILSYSGGSDSDILLDLVEEVRNAYELDVVDYCFFNTGLEMKAIKDHVKEVEKKYGVEIKEYRPQKNIVKATREFGQPFMSKIMSAGLEGVYKKGIPLSVHDEYWNAKDKESKFKELTERYPKCKSPLAFLCCCNGKGEPRPNIQLVINSNKYMLDFIKDNPPQFKISNKCCDCCKKQLAHKIQKPYELIITGERRDEGGMRSVPKNNGESMCFTETASGQYRLKPLFYVSDKDKEWYKAYKKIRYSDAYEVYGLKRTGCCGCSISASAVDDLEKIKKWEPNLVKAAWNVFGDSYRYRQKYNAYKAERMKKEKENKRGSTGR